MRIGPPLRALVLAAVAGTLLSGCARGPRLFPVSGTVKHNGNTLPAGVIYFNPDVTRGNDGPQGYAIIKEGHYDTAGPGGKGVLGGPYVVRIEGFDGKPGNELPLGKPIFTDYQVAVDLPQTAATQDFDVPPAKGKPKK
jgi:hypothetical protein